MAARKTAPILVRFLSKVDLTGPKDGCWNWTGSRCKRGYGRIGAGGGCGRPLLAHRVSYEELVGPIGEGLQIDHLCRNRACVNPAHLEPVTLGENLRRGERTRLSWADADDIRARRKRGESRRSVASRYGITDDYITSITNGSKWPPSQHPQLQDQVIE